MRKYVLYGPLGRLAKWLRLLGFDVLFFQGPVGSFSRESVEDDRVVVVKGLRNSFPGAVSIESDFVEEQVVEFISKTGEILNEELFFTRCSLCNRILEEISVREASARGVPEYVLFAHNKFRYCAGCERVYWPGTHRSRFLTKVRDISSRLKKDG